MGIFKRVSNIFRSKVNSALDSVENPIELLDQKVRDMEESLNKAKISSAQILGSVHETKKKMENAEAEVKDYDDKVKLALSKNNEELAKKIDKNVFPGVQGGPLMHVIGAKAVAFKEDLDSSYKEYIHQVILNAKAMADEFIKMGYKVVSNGTDNHLFLVDVKKSVNLTGKEVETLLEKVNITLNKNSIPHDELPPLQTSGIRIGTPAMTTRGFKEKEFIYIARLIDETIKNKDNEEVLKRIKKDVINLTSKFVIY